MLSEHIHPVLRSITRYGKCNCPNAEQQLGVVEDKWATINVSFPRLGLQSALDDFTNQTVMENCQTCKQLRHEKTERSLVRAPDVLAISINRIDANTRQTIVDLVNTPDVVNLPLAADSIVEPSPGNVSYNLSSAILPTPGHFLALLKHRGRFYRVSDAWPPVLAERLDIRKAEIYLFTKDQNNSGFM